MAAAADLRFGGRRLNGDNDRFGQLRGLAQRAGVLPPEAFEGAAHAGMRRERVKACLLEYAGDGGLACSCQLWLFSAAKPAR